MTKIVGIAIRKEKRAPMEELNSVKITVSNGLDGDSRGGGGLLGNRQVTVLSAEQWQQACEELGIKLPWHTRRANLCIDGITFTPEHLGRTIRIGNVELEITGETAPCKRMNEACPGLKEALSKDWRAGVTCKVIRGGTIFINSTVELI